MQKDIHPKYEQVTIECSCGNTFTTGSTRSSYKIDVCSACHPFFTGKQKLLDTEGRVEKFNKKFAKLQTKSKAAGASAA